MAGTDAGNGGALIADEIKRHATGLKDAVAHQAEDIAARAKDASADAIAAVGRGAECIADTMVDDLPALADNVRGAGRKIDRLANDLHDKSVGELLDTAAEFGRSRPLLLVAGGIAIGFALSQLIKPNAPSSRAARARNGSTRSEA